MKAEDEPLSIAIAVPYRRGGDPVREDNWNITRAYYEPFGLPIFVSDSDPAKPFNLSQARNWAVAQANAEKKLDIVIVADADTLLSPDGLVNALTCAGETGALVHASRRYWRLDEDGNRPDQPSKNEGGGVHIWGRTAWDVLGGYDERFEHWDDEDFAVLWAAETFGLYHEVDGDANHLWHQYTTDWAPGQEGWVDVVAEFGLEVPTGKQRLMSPLALRYARARGKPAAMRALLCERCP